MRERIIFDNLQLQVFSGDKVIIVGENGVGKTTLLKLIKGFSYTFNGSIKAEGNIGYLPQSFVNLSGWTVFEHLIRETNDSDLINLWKMRENFDKEEWVKQFNSRGGFQLMKLISQLNFSPQILDQNFASLSGGEKVKIHYYKVFFSVYNFCLKRLEHKSKSEIGN